MSKYRSTSVHLLGGCNASSDFLDGVCNPNGQVFYPAAPGLVHQGLYVCDASLIPCSVGVNPSLTIAAAAEHVSKHLVKDILKYKSKSSTDFVSKGVDQNPCIAMHDNLKSRDTSYVLIKEIMRGYIGGKVGGRVVFKAIKKDKLHIMDGEIDTLEVDYRTPYTQYTHYRLLLAAASGSRYILEGKKIMNPCLLALNSWRETTSLYVTFKRLAGNSDGEEDLNLKGEPRIP
ncbi:hypothetical protein PTKIN_Ptkin13bG0244600 [Pterospermum kingtungense]